MGGPWNILTTFPCLGNILKQNCLPFPALELTIYIFTVQCIFCGIQILKCFQMHPNSCYSRSCVIPSPVVWAEASDLFLKSIGILQKWWMALLRFSWKVCDVHLAHTSLWLDSLVHSKEKVGCHVSSCPGEVHLATKGGLQPTAVEDLRPSMQQQTKNSIVPPTHINLEADPFSVEP